MANKCPIRNTVAKNDWFDNTGREINHHQNINDSNDDESVMSDTNVSGTSASSARRATWSGHQIHTSLILNHESHASCSKIDSMRDLYDHLKDILLDTGSTFSIFCSR